MVTRPRSRQPIPPDARCVFSGEIFDVYQWRQTLFDGSSALFEKVRRPDTVYVLPVESKRLRVARQEQPGSRPSFGLIGGRVERGEAPAMAARRELAEEAGLLARRLDLWASCQFFPKIDWATHIFVGRDLGHTEPSLEAGERVDLIDVTFDELLDLAATDEFGDAVVALHLLRLAADAGRLAAARLFLLGD